MESALLLVFSRVPQTEAQYTLESWTKFVELFYRQNTKSVIRPLSSAGTEAVQWSHFVSNMLAFVMWIDHIIYESTKLIKQTL